MRKTIAVLLAAIMLFGCLSVTAFAEEPVGQIRVRLKSDVAGATQEDVQRFIELTSGHAVLGFQWNEPVSVADYAGTPESGKLVAGRTYYVDYVLGAAEGYVLPETLTDENLVIECEKGVTVISRQIVTASVRNETGGFTNYKGLRGYAKLVVDGNAIQRMVGILHDLILKIKAWSLY